MAKLKTLALFTGSSEGKEPCWKKGTLELLRLIHEKSIDMVYGGGNVGLMGALSSEMMSLGGKVYGVIPQAIADMVPHHSITRQEVVPDMHSRKARMYELSDGFIALPGGIGTLEEIFEVFTWQQLHYHSKPVALYNYKGFYDGLMDFLMSLVEKGFVKKVQLKNLIVEEDPKKLLQRMIEEEPVLIKKWG